MNVKKFLQPGIPKLLIFLFIGIFYLYFANEDVCAAGMFFKFCYKSYGFPFSYIVTGDIDNASDYIDTLPLGRHFTKSGNSVLNPAALALDILIIYFIACLISLLISDMKVKRKEPQ